MVDHIVTSSLSSPFLPPARPLSLSRSVGSLCQVDFFSLLLVVVFTLRIHNNKSNARTHKFIYVWSAHLSIYTIQYTYNSYTVLYFTLLYSTKFILVFHRHWNHDNEILYVIDVGKIYYISRDKGHCFVTHPRIYTELWRTANIYAVWTE